ncbi:MAG: hypothetical protein HOV68_30590 [Streptomycetaceae bacterium]|nr:hypothetical protein [Streptomycetaceae bacterium]
MDSQHTDGAKTRPVVIDPLQVTRGGPEKSRTEPDVAVDWTALEQPMPHKLATALSTAAGRGYEPVLVDTPPPSSALPDTPSAPRLP